MYDQATYNLRVGLFSGKNVLVFGDSLAQGLGPALSAAIRADGGYQMPTLSRTGWSSSKFDKTPDWLPGIQGASLILVSLGTNDDPQSSDSYARMLSSLSSKLRSGGAQVIWIGPPNVLKADIAARVSNVADLQGQILPGLGVTWVDSRRLAQSDAKDKVHFTPRGYQAWASALAPVAGGNGMLASTGSTWLWVAAAMLGAALLIRSRKVEEEPAAGASESWLL